MTQVHLWPTVVTFFASSLGALLTVVLALGRFRQERLWDAKFSAYNEVIASLQRVAAVNAQRSAEGSPLPMRLSFEDMKHGDFEALGTLQRHEQASFLLLDSHFQRLLEQFNHDYDSLQMSWSDEHDHSPYLDERSWPNHCGEIAKLAETALSEMRSPAEDAVYGNGWIRRSVRRLSRIFAKPPLPISPPQPSVSLKERS